MKKTRILLFTFLFFFGIAKGNCTDIIVKYIIEKDTLSVSKHSLSEYCLNIINNNYDNFDLNSKEEIPSIKQIIFNGRNYEIVLIKYKINRSGIYFLTDLLGHEIFLDKSMDKDTITLLLKKNKFYKKNQQGKNLLYLTDSIRSSVLYNITYPQKYKYMGFFDSLAYLHGDIRAGGGGFSFKQLKHNLPEYLSIINKVYSDRLSFLKQFLNGYKTPPSFRYYTFKEIQYSYYSDLIEPIVEWDAKLLTSYPAALKDSINNIEKEFNNNDLFDNISFYRTVTTDYIFFANQNITQIRSKRDQPDSAYLIDQMIFCKRKLKNESLGYSLASLMNFASYMDSKGTFTQLYQNFDHNKSNPGINQYVDSVYNIITNRGNFEPQEVLSLTFEDKAHQYQKLNEVFNKDFILIDCWATWCIPCRKQMPFLDSLANEYKDHVQFISISADQNSAQWDNWMIKDIKTNKLIIQLLAKGGFEHVFFRKLLINAIPRYILLSKSGKILNSAMPFPSQKDDFKKELKKYM